ncbi:copper homeostasis periplasmic binding protein CopC [Devosia submarina]|uniref:copper homeostasis periplasmic binding protein CopC n=1 Tax=Devosia submarina TaxID=1173082 RepID=UPI000D3428AD|nr:copper homeostasis periplasmic binding protein CopC [Devosia submarina]
MKNVHIRRWAPAAIALTLLLVAAPLPVYAHAELLETVPGQEQPVSSAPKELRLAFSESLELAFANVTVTGDDGQQIELGTLSLAPMDNKTVIVTVADELPSGTYIVEYSMVSNDGHKIEGSYTFKVAP